MGNYLRSFTIDIIIILLLFSSLRIFSQTNYSEKTLTGRGDLYVIGETYRLQKEVYEAFERMKEEALKEGISIQIISAYRSFDHQKEIWNKKYSQYISEGFTPEKTVEEIIHYSSIPGTSRHHWGTDIDIIDSSAIQPKSILIEKNYEDNGVYAQLKKWMDSNSKKFGFYLVYTNDYYRNGFEYEPWHYSYRLISKPMLHAYSKVDLQHYFKEIDLNGSKYLTLKFLKKYYSEHILSINRELK